MYSILIIHFQPQLLYLGEKSSVKYHHFFSKWKSAKLLLNQGFERCVLSRLTVACNGESESKIGYFAILWVYMCCLTETYRNLFNATVLPEPVLKYFSKAIAFCVVSTAT